VLPGWRDVGPPIGELLGGIRDAEAALNNPPLLSTLMGLGLWMDEEAVGGAVTGCAMVLPPELPVLPPLATEVETKITF